jgi:hypothetical protein
MGWDLETPLSVEGVPGTLKINRRAIAWFSNDGEIGFEAPSNQAFSAAWHEVKHDALKHLVSKRIRLLKNGQTSPELRIVLDDDA